jgi:hypothetical protein
VVIDVDHLTNAMLTSHQGDVDLTQRDVDLVKEMLTSHNAMLT